MKWTNLMRRKDYNCDLLLRAATFITVSLIFFSLPHVAAGQQPLLQITSPANGTIVNPGQNLSVNVSSPAGTAFAQVDVIGEYPIGMSTVATSVPAQFSITIPSDIAPGQYRLTAEGTTVPGQDTQSASITIDVERPDLPTSLTTLLSGVFFQSQSQVTPLIVLATFSDGSVLDVSRSTNLAFSSANTNTATVDATGLVTSVAPGTGNITATYTLGANSVQVSIPVAYSKSSGAASASNFFILVQSGAQTIPPGTTGSFALETYSYSGFSGSVALSVNGLPSGASASFSPASASVPGSSTMFVSIPSSTPSGTYPLTITGTSGTLSPSVSALLTVATPPDFSLSASPASQTITQGGSASYTVAVSNLNGLAFNGSVALSTGLPVGAATFSPALVNGPTVSTLTLSTSILAPTGNFTYTITGTDGIHTHTATVALSINPIVVNSTDFLIAPSLPPPATLTIPAGGAVSYTIKLLSGSGFSGYVDLTATGLPTGATANFSPTPVNFLGGGSSTLTVSTSTSTPPGSYPLTITGTCCGLTHTTNVTLKVDVAAGFSLSVTPGMQTVPVGGSTCFGVGTQVINGFTGNIALGASGLPAGATAIIGLPLCGSAGNAIITTTTTTPTGTYPVRFSATSGSLAQSITVPLTVAVNSISNGGFEQGSQGWALGLTQIITNSSAAHSGSHYLQFSASTAFTGYVSVAQLIPVSQGRQITFGGWVYEQSGPPGLNAEWRLTVFDANQNLVDSRDPTSQVVYSPQWTYQEGLYTVPAGAAYVRLVLLVSLYTSTPTTVRFDDGFLTVQ
jgi:hypothetical protein